MTELESLLRKQQREEIENLRIWFKLLRWIIGIVFTIVFLFLATVCLNDIPVFQLITRMGPSFFTSAALSICYVSWAIGVRTDLKMQEYVLVGTSVRGQVDFKLYAGIMSILLFGLLMIYLREEAKNVALALTAFSFICFYCLCYYKNSVIEKFNTARDVFIAEKDFFKFAQLCIVENYITGQWVIWRGAALIVLIILVDAVCFLSSVRDFLHHALCAASPHTPYIGSLMRLPEKYLPSISIFLFFAIAEFWQWIMRARADYAVLTLRKIRKDSHYNLELNMTPEQIIANVRRLRFNLQTVLKYLEAWYSIIKD